MLNYQSTSFHDALYIRSLLKLRPAPEFEGLARADRHFGRWTAVARRARFAARVREGIAMLTEDRWKQLRELTAARIALGRAGPQPSDEGTAGFSIGACQGARCRPSSAGFARVPLARSRDVAECRAGSGDVFAPADLGRRLAADSAARLAPGSWDAVIMVADGLSAAAVEQGAVPLIDAIRSRLAGWNIAPIHVVATGARGDRGRDWGEAGRAAFGNADRGTARAELAGEHGSLSDVGAPHRANRCGAELHFQHPR